MSGRRRWRLGTFVALLALLFSSTAEAARLRIDRVSSTSQGFLYVEFELEDPFEGLYLEAMRSGLPTTLNYTIEVWRQRTGWWDRLEATYERTFRIYHELLNDLYYVHTPDQTFRWTRLDSMTAAVCRFSRESQQGPQYFSKAIFRPDKQYYVVITATLAPLSVEDLNELDDWLRGTLAGRGDESGGISGITRTMGGLLMNMTGFGDKQIKSRTQPFLPSEGWRRPNDAPQVQPPWSVADSLEQR